MNILDFTGKKVLITGSSRGIGRAMALAFAEHGANVVIHGSSQSNRINQTVKDIIGSGGKAVGVAANLGDKDQIQTLVTEIISNLGNIDILILNASIQSYMTVEDFDPANFELEYQVNLKSSFELIKAFLPGMKKKNWGRVLSIGSVNQWKQNPRLAIYSSTKSAQVNLIMNCAREYAKYGITFNNLAPGVIETDRNKKVLNDSDFNEKILQQIPVNIFGKPEDCIAPALLLCSEASSYINGADLPVTGGMHL